MPVLSVVPAPSVASAQITQMELGAPTADQLSFPRLVHSAATTPAGVMPTAPASAADARHSVLDSLRGSGGKSASASAPATLPLAAAIPAAWLAAPAVPPPAPPPDAPVVTIDDRRVRLGPPGLEEEQQPSLYRLCRQWVQNDPDLVELPEPLPTSKLPPLPPHTAEAEAVLQQPPPQEPPLPPAGSSAAGAAGAAEPSSSSVAGAGSACGPLEVAELLKHHQQHWAAVRQHHQAQAAAAQQRHGQRLQAVLALGGGGVAQVVPAAVADGALTVPMQH